MSDLSAWRWTPRGWLVHTTAPCCKPCLCRRWEPRARALRCQLRSTPSSKQSDPGNRSRAAAGGRHKPQHSREGNHHREIMPGLPLQERPANSCSEKSRCVVRCSAAAWAEMRRLLLWGPRLPGPQCRENNLLQLSAPVGKFQGFKCISSSRR